MQQTKKRNAYLTYKYPIGTRHRFFMASVDAEVLRYRCCAAINAFNKSVAPAKETDLFSKDLTYRLFLQLHNQPQPFTIQMYVPRPALQNPLVVTETRAPHTVKTLEDCKVLNNNYLERKKWIAYYSAVVLENKLVSQAPKIFGASFYERRPFLVFEQFANFTGTKVNGTIFNIQLGTYENALENLPVVLEKLAEVFPAYDNVYQMYVGYKQELLAPVMLQVPPVGACYEEVFSEKDVLEELLGSSLEELQRQGIITEAEKLEIYKKQPKPLI